MGSVAQNELIRVRSDKNKEDLSATLPFEGLRTPQGLEDEMGYFLDFRRRHIKKHIHLDQRGEIFPVCRYRKKIPRKGFFVCRRLFSYGNKFWNQPFAVFAAVPIEDSLDKNCLPDPLFFFCVFRVAAAPQ